MRTSRRNVSYLKVKPGVVLVLNNIGYKIVPTSRREI